VEKTFEKAILSTLEGSAQKNALDFVSLLKVGDMTTGENHGTVIWKGDILAYIHMDGKPEMPGPWTIWPNVTGSVPEGFVLDEATRDIALRHINICADCGSKCAPGSRKNVYGKEFDNVCSAALAFTDPDADAIKCVIRLLELIKHDIFLGNKD